MPETDWPWLPADPDALSELSNLLQDCFPGMPAMTAEALAADELLSDALALVHARQACFRSRSIQSELVFVVLCGLALRFIDELNRLMVSRPHYHAALFQSGLAHQRRSQNGSAQGGFWPFDEHAMASVHSQSWPEPDRSS